MTHYTDLNQFLSHFNQVLHLQIDNTGCTVYYCMQPVKITQNNYFLLTNFVFFSLFAFSHHIYSSAKTPWHCWWKNANVQEVLRKSKVMKNSFVSKNGQLLNSQL